MAAATAEASTAAALGLGSSLVDVDGPSAELRAVQSRNGFLSVVITGHLNETEAPGTPSVSIRHDADTVHLTVAFKDLPQFIFIGIEAEIPHKNILHASSSALSCRKCELSSRTAGREGLPGNLDRSWRTVECAGSIAENRLAACQIEFTGPEVEQAHASRWPAPHIPSTFIDLPVALGMESHLKEPVLRVVALAASRTDQVTAPGGALAVAVFGDGEGSAAAARDKEHAEGSFDGRR